MIHMRRVAALYLLMLVCFGYLFFKLYALSVDDVARYYPALNGQYTTGVDVAYRRGYILDRFGESLAGVQDGYITLIDPSKAHNPPELARSLAGDGLAASKLLDRLKAGKPLTYRTALKSSGDGLFVYPYIVRHTSGSYPASHLVGYMNSDGDGVTGLEKAYDAFLKDSGAQVRAVFETDAKQRSLSGATPMISDTGYGEPYGLLTTLDAKLQAAVERIGASHFEKGAIVVADAATGQLLAGASFPLMDTQRLGEYLDSDKGELVNRMLSSFTPGSVFKTVIAAAALEQSEDWREFSYDCVGHIDVSGKLFNCHKLTGHGVVTMKEALANSCNTYFMTVALELGLDNIVSMAKRLGIGEGGGLDRLSAAAGRLPDNPSPPPALVANTAIGQGELMATPLEVTRIMCAVANGGLLPRLSLVRGFKDASGERLLDAPKPVRIFSKQTAASLREMLEECVKSGTGKAARPKYDGAGGKTASAESGQFLSDGRQVVHSWFAGFYPSSNPTFVITVIAEGGVTLDTPAAAAFGEVCDYLGEQLYG